MNIRLEKYNGKITATNKTALFKHCAGGSFRVSTRTFNLEVKPSLFTHGITSISTSTKTTKEV